MSDTEIDFIVGLHRSGTTYLQSLLGTFPNIGVLQETHFYCRVLPYLSKLQAKKNKTIVFKDLKEATVRIAFAGREEIKQWDQLRTVYDEGGYKHYFVELLRILNHRSDSVPEIIIEKTPSHLKYFSEIRNDFPDSKFIIIVRDPRSVFISFLKYIEPLTKRTRFQYLIKEVNYLQTMFGFIQKVIHMDDSNVKVIRFEDLIREKENTLIELCEFLDIDYDQCQSGDPAEVAKIIALDHEKHKENNKRHLSNINLQPWKDILTPYEVRLIEFILQDHMDLFNYQRYYFKGSSELYLLRRLLPILNYLFGFKRKKIQLDDLITQYIPWSPP